jgi:hypothetical protein
VVAESHVDALVLAEPVTLAAIIVPIVALIALAAWISLVYAASRARSLER